MLYTRVISLKRGSVLNTCSHDFIRTYIEHVTSRKRKNACFMIIYMWPCCIEI